jgi:hypothetical protein
MVHTESAQTLTWESKGSTRNTGYSNEPICSNGNELQGSTGLTSWGLTRGTKCQKKDMLTGNDRRDGKCSQRLSSLSPPKYCRLPHCTSERKPRLPHIPGNYSRFPQIIHVDTG